VVGFSGFKNGVTVLEDGANLDGHRHGSAGGVVGVFKDECGLPGLNDTAIIEGGIGGDWRRHISSRKILSRGSRDGGRENR